MTSGGDRAVAGLLSALAEAHDFRAAAALLLAEIADITGARRLSLLRIDAVDEQLTAVTTVGDDIDRAFSISIEELSNPLVLCALSQLPLRGRANIRGGTTGATEPIVALPLSQPAYTGAMRVLSSRQFTDLRAAASVAPLPAPAPRAGSVPAGVIAIAGDVSGDALDAAIALVLLAAPILGRLAQLEGARINGDRLARERDQLTLMVDSLPDPVVITDAANEIVAHNHRAGLLLRPRDSDSADRRRTLDSNIQRFSSFSSDAGLPGTQRSERRELSLVDPDDGHPCLFEVVSRPLGEGVEPAGAVLTVLRDVTDLRRAADELERQVQLVRQAETTVRGERDRLNLVLENVADPILVTDERSSIILMNDGAEQLFQIANDHRHSPREVAAVRNNNTKFTSFISDFALDSSDARRVRMSLTDPRGGAALPVEVLSGKVKNERGDPIAVVSVLHDLTKQVENERLYEALKQLNGELEERIREATADLAEQNARLQWQSQEVERANKLKSEFLASMSHELRTPINALIGYSALLLDGLLGEVNPRQRDALTRGRAAAEHLLNLVNDILDLARIEAGKMPLHLETVALREVIREVTQQMEPMVRKKQLDFGIDVASDCPTIVSDRTKIKQILLNLLSNAVKFTNHGRVAVEARCTGDGVRIDVIDTGIGIRADNLQAIWEDFRQVDQSRTREYGGTGLGLSITRKLLERLGGSVTVRSNYGSGSTFSVVLPNAVPAASLSDSDSYG